MSDSIIVVRHPAQAAVALDPIRLDILRELQEPQSASAVAATLGLPRQRLGYHVRELQKAGFLRIVGRRKRRALTEKLLQTTARVFVLSPEVLARAGVSMDQVKDSFSSEYLIAAAARTIQDVAILREAAAEAGKRLPTLTFEAPVRFASFADQQAFARDLVAAVARVVARYNDTSSERGRGFRIVIAGHPALDSTVEGRSPTASHRAAPPDHAP
jgi:DNA-binding Lrp family transcriptional regulator